MNSQWFHVRKQHQILRHGITSHRIFMVEGKLWESIKSTWNTFRRVKRHCELWQWWDKQWLALNWFWTPMPNTWKVGIYKHKSKILWLQFHYLVYISFLKELDLYGFVLLSTELHLFKTFNIPNFPSIMKQTGLKETNWS